MRQEGRPCEADMRHLLELPRAAQVALCVVASVGYVAFVAYNFWRISAFNGM